MKCPECGKEITIILCVESGYMVSEYDGKEHNIYEDWIADGDTMYQCPECRHEITNLFETERCKE